jgi:type I site-specific restriction endonuclease
MGYEDEQEAVGFGFTMWEGVSKKRVQADLVYFGNEVHSIDEGAPLVLVEAKGPSQEPHAGTGQAKSYAYWLKPAYYVTTNGNVVCVYDYQGGAVPDAKVLEFERSDLQTQFEVLRQLLNPAAASAARKQKTERLMKNAPSA